VAGDLSAELNPTRYFVDTNILGIVSSRNHRVRNGYLDLIASEEFDRLVPSISVIVVAEVEQGLPALDKGETAELQLAAAMRAVLATFDRIELDAEGVAIATALQRQARAVGHPIGADAQRNDLLIAALAIRHRAPLISHNYRDFVNIDVLDLRTLAPILKRPPLVRFRPDA
jgi:predicted nucleic acid-binding protein